MSNMNKPLKRHEQNLFPGLKNLEWVWARTKYGWMPAQFFADTLTGLATTHLLDFTEASEIEEYVPLQGPPDES